LNPWLISLTWPIAKLRAKIAKLKYSYGFKKRADSLSISFRRELGLSVHDALPSKVLADHLGVLLLSQPDCPGLSKTDLLNLNGQSGWSGATFECEDQPIILYNSHHSDARNESTIMHELSHIILKHKARIEEDLKHLGLLLRNYDEIHENEANWLGGSLQVPFDGLVTALLKNKSSVEIARQYGASIDMVNFRINKSGAKQKVYYIKKNKRR
jgi:hypothetical protein